MRRILFIAFILYSTSVFSQVKTSPEGYQYFEMASNDSTIIMKQYFICFLKSGPQRSQNAEEAANIQEKHLQHLAQLYNDGHTCATGPFGDEGETRGIVIFKTATLEEAERLANNDPAVKAGRLVVEIRPWWAMKGSILD